MHASFDVASSHINAGMMRRCPMSIEILANILSPWREERIRLFNDYVWWTTWFFMETYWILWLQTTEKKVYCFGMVLKTML